MSSPENIDPADSRAGSSESPDEPVVPRKTRYGRIVVPKGNLPGEDQIPKIRKKKLKPVEPIKPKRKYTKRKERTTESKDQEETAAVKEKKAIEVRREVKEEEPEQEEAGAWDDDGAEFNARPVRPYATGREMPATTSNAHVNEIPSAGDERIPEPCDICGMVLMKYEMERHKLDNHPEHAPYECLSCRIRSFYDYWELKEHYKLCSNGRIGCVDQSAVVYNAQVEAAFFRRIYLPVECPLCRIYLPTFFDLDLHFNAHGLATMDAKFACEGCRITFTSVDALKKHLTQKNTPYQAPRCFNTGRVLTRQEIEKMKQRFSDADRKDCLRNFSSDEYVIAAPKIFENAREAICAFCDRATKAYALIKTDLSNLVSYGLECSEETEREVIQKIQHSKAIRNNRVPICRHHFQWRNWLRKEDERNMPAARAAQMKQLSQKLIARKKVEPQPRQMHSAVSAKQMHQGAKGDARERHNGMQPKQNLMVVREQQRRIGNLPMKGGPGYSIKKQRVLQLDEEKRDAVLFKKQDIKKEVKKEEEWDDGISQLDYDIIDISDDEGGQGASGDLPLFMEQDQLEEKVSASMRLAYPCPVCESSYPTLQDLHEHQDTHPETRLQYLCADCPGKTYASPDDVYKHFDEKMKSPVAALYSYNVLVQIEGDSNEDN